MEQPHPPASAESAPAAQQAGRRKSFWSGSNVLIPIGAVLLSNFIGRTLGILGIAIVWGPLLLALWLSSWYTKRKNPSGKLLTRLAWSNTATWLFPPLGLFTASATLGMSNASGATPRKYRVLGVIGLVLSALNGLAGALLRAQ